MLYELLIQNKSSGQIYNVTNAVTSADWTTQRCDQPGKFTFSVLQTGDWQMEEGDVVRFSIDGELQFYGWVFTRSENRWKEVNVTCYDRIRYLKANASYAFYAMSAGEIIQQIAGDLQLTTGSIADTGYKLPSLVEQDKSCIDIIQDALQQTLLNTGKVFVLYDDGQGLALQESASMMSDVVLGDKSLLTDYTYTTDIDKQTYNSVKLSRPDEDTGRSSVVIAQDSANIAQWGLLQLYQTVDGALNDAQMQAQAEATLAYYNYKLRTLTVSTLGVLGLRAGQFIFMNIPKLGDINLEQYILLEQVTHTWENSVHTMELEGRIVIWNS